MTDPAGGHSHYDYDGQGDLTQYTDPAGGLTKFAYDSQQRMTQITSPRGNQTKVAYDGATRRVASMTTVTDSSSGSGDSTGFAYTATDCGQDSSKNVVGKTVVTDPNSHPTSYCYDKDLEVKHVADALGHTKNKNYDPNSNVTSVTDPGGDVSKANYSSDNKLTSTAMPTGASSTFSYGDSSNPYQSTMVTNPRAIRPATTTVRAGASRPSARISRTRHSRTISISTTTTTTTTTAAPATLSSTGRCAPQRTPRAPRPSITTAAGI